MSAIKRRPSLLGGLLWTGAGVLFLMRNFSMVRDLWSIAARYWPILLILLGLGKVIDYYRQKEGVSLRFGEVFGIFFLLMVGSIITKVEGSHLGRVIREMPINIGEVSVRPGQWIGTSYSYTQEAAYPIGASTPLRFENSYGLVSVLPGSDGEVRVRLRKVVYQNEESRAKAIADEIRLEGGPEGKSLAEAPPAKAEAEAPVKSKAATATFVVRTNRDALSSKDYRFNTEMEVFVPKKSAITVSNAYGEVRVTGIEGKVDLTTTHNPIDVRECSGEVAVSNRYAESRLTNLKGNVTVDARGRVFVESVTGDVLVRNEYSPVEIRDITGKVTVSDTDSSISVDKVTREVIIDGPGCEVSAHEIAQACRVVASHKRIQISQIDSNVNLDSKYATVSLKEIKGNLDVTSNSDRLTFDGIGGYVKVRAEGSGVHADTLAGPVEILTNRKDVTVNNFENACKVVNEYGDVTLSTRSLGKGELNVKNRNGGIDLFLPEGAAFQIDATARNGRVDSDFSGLESTQGPGEVGLLKGRLKTGGPKIVLETEYNNIHLRTREGDDSAGPNPTPGKGKRPKQTV
jgi:DUF4097 and DUF4098 domain-containing protein YvlB